MYICFVTHGGVNREYLFDCTGFEKTIEKGTHVICQTMRGEALGIVTTSPALAGECECVNKLIKAAGAYFPLKKIIRIDTTLTLSNEEKERIAKEWLREKLGGELPF